MLPPSRKLLQRGLPERPRLVVIWMTPFAAAVPYCAAAAGPFRTSNVSISSGLMSLNRDGTCPPTPIVVDPVVPLLPIELLNRIPSTTIRGSLVNEIDEAPRMRIRDPEPTVPPACCTSTPGTLPLNN